jgi:hypothetical protein
LIFLLSDKNKNITRTSQYSGFVFKNPALKQKVIEKNSTVIDTKFSREFYYLLVTIEFFDLQIFLQVYFCMKTSATQFAQGGSST